MDVRNADSLPRVGVCFCRDESLSALAVVYRGVEGGLSVFRGSDPLPAASCLLSSVSRAGSLSALAPWWAAYCRLPAASCLLFLGCRPSRPVGGRGPAFFTLSREEFNNLKSQIVTSSRVSSRTVCDIRENLKGLGYGV
jgi:hypothetical protein